MTLGIGVIGAGGRGALSLHAHDPENGVRVVAACDTHPKALADYNARVGGGAFCTADHRELLRRPDVHAVFVTTPDFLHEAHAVAALKAGKDVYLEKPMAITLRGCDRILRVAAECGRKLFVGHNMRHMGFVQKMRELILDGAIGEVKAAWCRHFISYGGDAYFKDWHADRTKSTGLLLQKAAHDIDVLHWLCGGVTRQVVAQGGLTLYDRIKSRHTPGERGDASWSNENWPPLSQKHMNPVMDVEDVSHVLMRLDNGGYAFDFTYDASGRAAGFRCDGLGRCFYLYNLQGDVVAVVAEDGVVYAEYTYDAWGNALTATGDLAGYNPIRYRGYYWDDETGMYYLHTRYYNPQWGRFLNADCMLVAGNALTATNMYAYCNGNPVMLTDPNGDWAILEQLMGTVIGFAAETFDAVKRALDSLVAGDAGAGSVGIEPASMSLTPDRPQMRVVALEVRAQADGDPF
ncbi:MAG: Gfo/Idh/MocA family oxidoreductase, partial [Kiritimatiellaeota bacterium]|nr:Gfo/Idh/MocA family oxidoreductase [Kiritimatiellota bacterium]